MDFKALGKQFAGFAVVGILAFLIDFGLLMVLSQLVMWPPVVAAFVSYLIATVFNYFAEMHFVFEHRDDLSRKKEFSLFLMFSLVSLVLNELIIGVGTAWLGTGPSAVTISKLGATLLVSIWNFGSRYHWLDAGKRS